MLHAFSLEMRHHTRLHLKHVTNYLQRTIALIYTLKKRRTIKQIQAQTVEVSTISASQLIELVGEIDSHLDTKDLEFNYNPGYHL